MMQYIDKLTGLYVQKYFERRLEEELARTNRYRRPLTLLMFEINYNFFMPEYNIRWAMVYTVLKQFGSVLLKQLRNVDLAGRYGGDMFTVLLPETPMEGGKVAAERIRGHVEEHTFIGDNVMKNIRIALDGGLATCPIHGKTTQELFSSAHQGLLIARNQGGNKVVACPHELYDHQGESLLFTDSKESEEEGKTEEKEIETETTAVVKAEIEVKVEAEQEEEAEKPEAEEPESKEKPEEEESEKESKEPAQESPLRQQIEKKKEELKESIKEKIEPEKATADEK